MALLGRLNTLSIVRPAPPGLYLDGGTHGEILLPRRYVPPDAQAGQQLEVFVYRDSEDRLVASTDRPFAIVGQCACLRVVSTKPGVGAFLDWGLEKDLLLPLREETRSVRPLDWVVVHLGLDEKSDRIIASARLDRHLDQAPPPFTSDQAVSLLIECETPLGYRAIVEHTHRGLLYRTDLATPLKIGQSLKGFIRTIRPDGKIDLSLQPAGYRRIASVTDQILEKLRAAGGQLPFHDGSSPDEIRAAFGISKKAFKQALGALYRERRVVIDDAGFRISSKQTA